MLHSNNATLLRCGLRAAGLWETRRQRSSHRRWRARKEHAGELVQMDGSHHDWFEGRRDGAVLMVAALADRFSGTFYEPRDVRDRLGLPVFATFS